MTSTTNQEKQAPLRWGFLSIDRATVDLKNQPLDRGCCAFVSISPDDPKVIKVDALLLLDYDTVNCAKEILKKRFKQLWVDKENFDWIYDSWRREVNRIFLSEKHKRGSLPTITFCERDKDLIVRQQSTLSAPDKDNLISYAASISSDLKNKCQQWGHSVVADALAGAVMVVSKKLPGLESIIRMEKRSKDIGPIWLGLERQSRVK
jgi:hypothetical protein